MMCRLILVPKQENRESSYMNHSDLISNYSENPHDRPGQDTEVTVQVFSSDGTAQWTGSAVDSSASGVTMITWNLHGSSGHRMQPGLYFVRATVKSGKGTDSASCKLVIVGP